VQLEAYAAFGEPSQAAPPVHSVSRHKRATSHQVADAPPFGNPGSGTHNDDSQSGMASGRSTEFLLIVPPGVSSGLTNTGAVQCAAHCTSLPATLVILVHFRRGGLGTPLRRPALASRSPPSPVLPTAHHPAPLTPVTQPPPTPNRLPLGLRRLPNFAEEVRLLLGRDEVGDAGVSVSARAPCGKYGEQSRRSTEVG
jgi:hypothetical protein